MSTFRKAIVAIDSFKGCLSTFEAEICTKQALVSGGADPDDVIIFPVSDGGDGFCKVIQTYVDGQEVSVRIHAPLGDTVKSHYYLSDSGIAYIESAAACGYTMVPDNGRTPLRTSSFGLGEMIRDALEKGATGIIVGLGGTATCDAGVGMLQALGVKFILDDGMELREGDPAMMKAIAAIDARALAGMKCPVEAWSDTGAGFWGPRGAVAMYGKQKGVTEEMMPSAEEWMLRMSMMYGKFMKGFFHRGLRRVEGAGAAGGIGGALHAMLGARVLYGAEQMIYLSGMVDAMRAGADMVITGEGRYDVQTLTGKMPACIAMAARKAGVPTVACLCGSAGTEDRGPFDMVIPITPKGQSLSEAMKPEKAMENLRKAILSNLI